MYSAEIQSVEHSLEMDKGENQQVQQKIKKCKSKYYSSQISLAF